MNSAETAAKSVEVSKCLINKESGFHDSDLYATNTIGNVARLAANFRQRGIISYNELTGISQVIKQDFTGTLNAYLPLLQKFEWVEINKNNKSAFIQEYVPPIEDVLKTLGEEWVEMEPTGVDIGTIECLEFLKNKPISKEGLISEIDISEESLDISLDYGKQLDYFGTFNSNDGEEIVWTPFYWPGKTDKILKFLKKQTYPEFDKIESISRQLSKYQGMPLEMLNNKDIINAGIFCGFFPSAGVLGGNKLTYDYIFKASPNFGIDPKNDIFEKARQIVACVRHGQYHAENSKIRYPVLLLRALRNNGLGAHSYTKTQYATLLMNGVCKFQEIYVGQQKRYEIKFVETPENNVAMDIAEEMLSGEEPLTASIREPEIDNMFTRGVYRYNSEQRLLNNRATVEAKDQFERLIDVTCGKTW